LLELNFCKSIASSNSILVPKNNFIWICRSISFKKITKSHVCRESKA